MLLLIMVAQIAASSTTAAGAQSDQERIMSSEVFAYAQWRNCVLRATHRKASTSRDHTKVADAAISACEAKEANYRASLLSLAQLYQLKNSEEFAQRNSDQGRKALRDMAIKELE